MNTSIGHWTGVPVLVTGATGFTGSRLVRDLVSAGAMVRALARPSSDQGALDDLAIEWMTGDLANAAFIEQAVQGIHYIFHLATLYRTPTATENDHRLVHVESTRLLAEAAQRQPDFKRFVLVSTVGVHGHVEHPPADEQAPFNPGDEYQRTKLEAEQWLTSFAARTGLDYSIIRPCAIYGPGDRRLLKLFKMAQRPFTPVLGRRPCLYHLIHVEDLSRIIMLAAQHPRAAGEAFIAGYPDPIPLDAMLRIIAKALRRKSRIIRLPVAPFWTLAVLCEKVCPRLGVKPPLYRRRIKFFLNDRAFDTSKIRDQLGYTCLYSNEQGLTDTAQWYTENGYL
jgi:dihydroflavonol-4-reductase